MIVSIDTENTFGKIHPLMWERLNEVGGDEYILKDSYIHSVCVCVCVWVPKPSSYLMEKL